MVLIMGDVDTTWILSNDVTYTSTMGNDAALMCLVAGAMIICIIAIALYMVPTSAR